jgi:hypothetical protein
VNHEISLAVWDLASPVLICGRATVKVGISCPCGCSMSGATIEICDEDGATVATGRAGSEPWPGTIALYWTELDVAAPQTEGMHAWSVHASIGDLLHTRVESVIALVASSPPEHRVTFEVVEQGSRNPVPGVELRVGVFRATTNEMGRAQVDVPGGTYDVHAWKLGYDLLSRTASVGADTTLLLEIPVTLSPEQPYWM